MIVVTTAYRLNMLGFYTDYTAEASGNWGLMDQTAALEWVKRNIDSFGGAANSVTTFGQGAGAVSVGLHAVSPGSRDKFHRAISMSGNALLRTAVNATGGSQDSGAILFALAERFNCYESTLTGCLRNMNATELVLDGSRIFRWGPVVDGPMLVNNTKGLEPFLPDEPATLMDAGQFAIVPHLIGYNRMEDAFEPYFRAEGGGGVDVDGFTRDRFEALVRNAVVADFDDEEDRRQRSRLLRQQQQQQLLQQQQQQQQGDDSEDGGSGGVKIAGDENCTLDSDFPVDTVLMRYARRTDDSETLRRNYLTMAANKMYGATGYRMAEYVARRGAPAYVYRYEYKLRATKALPTAAEWMDAPHGAELPLVWGMPYWPAASTAVDWTAADRRMSDVMMALWTNFAKHADPVQRPPTSTSAAAAAVAAALASVRWEEYQPAMPRSLVLDKVPNMSLPDQEPEFWNEYYPKVMAVSLQCCPNFTVDSAADVSSPRLLVLTVILLMPPSLAAVAGRPLLA